MAGWPGNLATEQLSFQATYVRFLELMPTTFINYRRDDAAGYAGRLHEALENRLGRDQVFRDVDTLEDGVRPHPRIAHGQF